MNVEVSGRIPAVGRFELWMLAHAAVGLVGVGGMMFLIPLYVLAQGGTPADAGAVMALASALALAGPFLGGLADRFGAYRGVQLSSLALLVLAAVSFSFAREELTWLVAAALLGLGMAGLAVVNPTFVVGAGFAQEEQARRLAMLQLTVPSGQVVGLGVMAGLSALGMSLEHMFLVLAAIGVLFLVAVASTNRGAVQRLLEQQPVTTGAGVPAGNPTSRPTLRQVLVSPFGLVLLMSVLIVMSAQGIESQYPNYMKSVFAIDPAVSAGALSVMVLLSIPLYPLAGRWSARSGNRVPFIVSGVVRALAGAGLLLLADDAGGWALVVFALVMLTYSFFEMGSASLVAATSPIGPGAGQGALGGAMALGTMAAAVLAGWLADHVGYHALAVITVSAAGLAAALGITLLREPGADHVGPRTRDEASTR